MFVGDSEQPMLVVNVSLVRANCLSPSRAHHPLVPGTVADWQCWLVVDYIGEIYNVNSGNLNVCSAGRSQE
jgi:hypothetical protein